MAIAVAALPSCSKEQEDKVVNDFIEGYPP
jgi:hypothetical protein